MSDKVFVSRAVEDRQWYIFARANGRVAVIEGPFRTKREADRQAAMFTIRMTPQRVTPLTESK